MTIDVKIKTIGPMQSGEKRDGSGKWFAKDLVLEVCDGTRFPDEFVVRVTGDNAQNNDYKEGQLCQADISFSTREYNGRYYQDVWGRSIAPLSAPPSGRTPEVTPTKETGDDLPF